MTETQGEPMATMPMLGLGTFKSEPGLTYHAVKDAIKIGYRHIDCAPVYGNQLEVGEAIRDVIAEGVIRREQLWITSKLWNDSHKPEDVLPALEQTLSDLKIDSLDLYLMHWPVAVRKGLFLPEKAEDLVSLEEIPLSVTWKEMEEMVGRGLCRNIGVSNFSHKKIAELVAAAQIIPFANQVENHPYLQQDDLLQFCHSHEIILTAYSPLGSPDRPDRLKVDEEPVLMQEPTIQALAEKHSASAAQILISWLLTRGAAVIPKSTNAERMRINLESVDIKLSEDDMCQIRHLDRHRRYYNGTIWTIEGSSYQLENLWDE